MFEGLSERLGEVIKRLSGRGRLGEADVDIVMREVRMALLEADVQLDVVKEFVATVRERAVGADVLNALSPAQSVIKIVNDELVALMGGTQARIAHPSAPPTILMMVGLQGAGKTTHAGKLALSFKEGGRRSLLVAADVYRPAAIDQLQALGKQIEVPVFAQGQGDPVAIAQAGVQEAKRLGIPTVIIDTAGRLQIDDQLMQELEAMKAALSPHEILFVADSMTGQEATNVARVFNERLGITGVILTKLDGDTRGGAALSIRKVTGAPIKYIGTGEKLNALEPFFPDRIASRILGMGDVLTLIEKTQSLYSEQQAKELEQKFRKQQFTLDDFLKQLRDMRKLGSMSDLLKMIPGVGAAMKNIQVDEREVDRVEAIICSMTLKERANPDILDGSRRKRIAKGSGTEVAEVNRLMKQFEQARQLMKQMSGMMRGGKMPRLPMQMPKGPRR